MNEYVTCPVCGYAKEYREHDICTCCGIHFGYDDATLTHDALREEWLQAGVPWFSKTIPAPNGWSISSAARQMVQNLEQFKDIKNR